MEAKKIIGKQKGKPEGWEKAMIEGLKRHPELRKRFEAILQISEMTGQKQMKADEIEEQLIEQTRQLGNQAMTDWAKVSEEQSAERYKKEHPQAGIKKKRQNGGVSLEE